MDLGQVELQHAAHRRRRAAPLLKANIDLTEPQEAAIEALRNEAYRIVIMGGGNRMGKSFTLALVLVCMTYGYWIHLVPDLQLTLEGDYPDRSTIHPQSDKHPSM